MEHLQDPGNELLKFVDKKRKSILSNTPSIKSNISNLSPEEKVRIEKFYNELSKTLNSKNETKKFLQNTIKKNKKQNSDTKI